MKIKFKLKSRLEILCPENGIALMMTLWVLVLLVAIVMEFTHSTRTEINTTINFKEEIESYYLAKAGINLAIAEILQPVKFHAIDKEGDIVFGRKNTNEPADKEENKITDNQAENIASEDTNTLELTGTEKRKKIKLGNGSFSYSIKDENGRLNLNIVPRKTIVKILELSGLDMGSQRDTIADSVLDWRDKDSLHQFNGAEDDYYRSLDPPYESKDGLFDTVEELLLVKGMTEEIFYGTEKIKKKEESDQELLGIYDLLTVQNIEFINPNTADKRVLKVLYSEEKTEKIFSARKEKGKYDNSKSSHFVVESTGVLNNSSVRRTIKATFEKIGYGSQAFLVTKYWNDNKIR